MSFKRLCKNYMTVQTSEGSVQNKDGSIDREGSWVNLFENIKCHIQEKSKQTVTERYGRLEQEHDDRIYHYNKDLANYEAQTEIRIISNKSKPKAKVKFPIHTEDSCVYKDDNDDLVDIYQFKGHIVQVSGKKVFIIRVERNKRWVT